MNFIITTIQSDLIWEEKSSNLAFFEKAFEEVNKKSKLIVLPEMFTTGFSMNPEKFAEKMNGHGVDWLKKQANRLGKYICGSLIIEEKGVFYNRLIVVSPDGKIKTYDKKHLFRYSDEHKNYSSGSSELIINIEGVKIAFYVCYDLRFPVWSRNNKLKYDIAVYIANWPERRRNHWTTLLKARAIENQAYVIGVNRIGNDGNGINHSGDSAVYNATGTKLSFTQPYESKVENVQLNIKELQDYREKFPVYLDADEFKLL